MSRRPLAASILAVFVAAAVSHAATSTQSVPSVFGGNGHNASFDGRLYLVRTGPGWMAYMLRPEGITYRPDGLPDATGPIWSDALEVVSGEPNGENALGICEPDPARAPFACDAAGNPGGPFACYDVWVFDSDATRNVAMGGQTFRRRHLLLRVENPNTASARPVAFSWGALETLSMAGGGALHGIEPTFTRDGRLMVWNGSLANGDQDGQMMYSVAPSACALSGWSTPRSLSHMINDPAVNTTYRLAMRQLRAADGTPFPDGAPVYGAYPWLLPDGDGVMFSAALMPCQGPENPPGCGPRRNATSVLGYPTNWAIAHIDGGVNPSTTDTVRLFFSSPGATTFSQLPVTPGNDVWPFFGTNTSNYVEISFDDGLDGQYGGMWHMNESVTPGGDLDPTRSPDVSGYFNTAVLRGAVGFPGPNNGVLGKALDATNGWVEVDDDPSLQPINGITMEMTIRPLSDPDCDGQNNFRVLLRKGDGYSLVLEETRGVRARVRVEGGEVRDLYSGVELPVGEWTKVAAEYDAASGTMQIYFNDQLVAEQTFAPALVSATADDLTIGGIGNAPACPVGGNFHGTIDEVSVSRISRHLGTPEMPDADPGAPDASTNNPGADGGSGGGDGGGGCCQTGDGGGGAIVLAIVVVGVLIGGGRRRRRERSDLGPEAWDVYIASAFDPWPLPPKPSTLPPQTREEPPR
jgi:hypothetical protein